MLKVFRALTACCCVFVQLGLPTAAQAEGFRLIKLDGGYLKWGESKLGAGAVVTYSLVRGHAMFAGARNCRAMVEPQDLLAASNIRVRQLKSELAAAARAWEAVANIRFRYVDDPENAQLLIGAQARPRGRAFANVEFERPTKPVLQGLITLISESDAKAFRLRRLPLYRLKRALVCLNPAQKWKIGFDGDLTRYDLRYTLMHEIGHAIGLNHAGRRGSLMSFKYNETSRDLRVGDIAGVRLLYGTRGVAAVETNH